MRTFQFGLFRPEQWDDQREKHFRLQVDYWNTLAEMENQLQAEQDAIFRSHVPYAVIRDQIEHTQQQIGEAFKQKRESNRKARRRVETPELDEEIIELKDTLTGLYEANRRLFAEARRVCKDQTNELKTRRMQLVGDHRRAFAANGLWWGNYNAVTESYDTIAARLVLGQKLQPKEYRGEGRFTVKFQRSIDQTGEIKGAVRVADFMDGKHPSRSLARIEPLPAGHPLLRTGLGARGKVVMLTMKIAGTRGINDIYMQWPLAMHRDFPTGEIKKITVNRRRRAPGDYRWIASFVVDEPEMPTRISTGRTIGLDPGWRDTKDGIRLLMGYDGNGFTEFLLPQSWIDIHDDIDRTKGELDDWFNSMLDLLDEQDASEIPSELLSKITEFRLIDYPRDRDLTDLVAFWREAYPAVLPEALSDLLDWRKVSYRRRQQRIGYRNAHLIGNRKEEYRKFAKHVADTYDVVCIDSTNIAQIATAKSLARKARRIRAAVAPAELIMEIDRAVKAAGGTIIKVAGPTTRRCHCCGFINPKPEDAGAQVWTCARCQETWDRDMNSAQNVLAAGTSPNGLPSFTVKGPKTKTLVRAKITRKGTARKVPNTALISAINVE